MNIKPKIRGKLTKKQKSIYDFILKSIRKNGFPPSYQEIADEFEFKSKKAVSDHLTALEKKGWIHRVADKCRAIEVVDSILNIEGSVLHLPVVGRVTAGKPILAVENIDSYMAVDRSFVKYDNAFLLRVEGNSMIDAHIMDKDYVLVKPQAYADNGEIVVAMINDEATIKRFFNEGEFVRLQPENPAMEPIVVRKDKDNVQIIGKIIAIFRKMG